MRFSEIQKKEVIDARKGHFLDLSKMQRLIL